MKVILLTLSAWVAGIAAYLVALPLFYNGFGSLSRLPAFLLWTLVAAFVIFPLLYLPCLLALRRLLHGCKPVLLFPLAACLLGFVSTFLTLFLLGTSGVPDARMLLGSEARFLYGIFTVVGLIVGFGFVRLYGRSSNA